MVPFICIKGWAGEENPCICNHLMQPMTTIRSVGLQPFPISPPPMADGRSDGRTPTTLKAQAHLPIHASQNPHSQLILVNCLDPRRISGSQMILSRHPTLANASPTMSPHTSVLAAFLTTPQVSLTPISQPTQRESPITAHKCRLWHQNAFFLASLPLSMIF